MSELVIKTREQRIEEVKNLAESLKDDFVAESVKFLSNWYKEYSEKFIESFPDVKNSLSDDRIRSMRREVKELCQHSEDLIIPYFNDEEHWWHFGETTNQDRDHYKSINNLSSTELRRIFGRLGEILEDYGFIEKNEYDGSHGFHSYKDGSNLYHFEYVFPIYWADMMKRRIDNYWENYKYYLTLAK